MPNTSRTLQFYVLRNTDTGSDSRHESIDEALDAVNGAIGEGDEWVVIEIDSLNTCVKDRIAGERGAVRRKGDVYA